MCFLSNDRHQYRIFTEWHPLGRTQGAESPLSERGRLRWSRSHAERGIFARAPLRPASRSASLESVALHFCHAEEFAAADDEASAVCHTGRKQILRPPRRTQDDKMTSRTAKTTLSAAG